MLKHRIVGAAFLLFFGALFLPWVLGPPSEAVKIDIDGEEEQIKEVSSAQIEDELLASLEAEQASTPEQVYISKITPLDSLPDPDSGAQPESQANASADPSTSAGPEVSDDNSEKKPDPPVSQRQAAASPAPDSEQAKAAVPAQADDVKPEQAAQPKIDVGWVVQVGIYTNPQGVSRVLQDLRSKGFNPVTTVVDTNRGKGTGTRIWLGPFAQRVEAAKIKSRLTERTGEAGFIRAYP